MEEEDDKVCPLEGFVQQQQQQLQQHLRSTFQQQQLQTQQQKHQQQQHVMLVQEPDSAGDAEAVGDYGPKTDRLMENVRFQGNFAATSVTTNASVQSFQSVLTSSSSASKKTKFHSFLQSSSSAATTQQSFSSLGATSSGFHQALSSQALKSSHTFSGLAAISLPPSIPSTPTQLAISPGFEKMFGEMEATNELKLKKSLQLNRKISILSPAHLSIRSEQTKEERTSCYINAEALE